ncbi:phosphoribosylanthranilate isomerase [Mammaliicoccus sciuri]|uniref:N-(5'-phosphoribosyl)anthranilate isomerase n=1 Tax=Mammaliicoccus sciuri TaxID=1296 RepID=A0AAI8DHM2_MAMSC|nr:phosphoribosylanthranilate isomerase [Mammaliicoccus sciuri]PCQ21225.1 phosphoribosylanthranilate isomerase [Klebsiella pneumoniae]ASE34231.1 phosphoribosylanthranilate isomerase [Mammaliicoccus sciuri]MCY1049151.1 phosphoribosylanthranilate isomerase [Mammaliicoccus sciuri]MCY1052197.1 phosphoribosylanthranilate isomerase [Mammaliicoccus sciuri]MEB6247527.1 phosphoribosylanthranilate isomerase [Mammaliicoccus sciuri]
MFIKCCGFQDKVTIETAVLNHVDAIGFITYPKSKRYVSVEEIKSLSKDIPQTIDIVAVVVNLTMVEIDELIRETSINTLQFHGDESVSFIQEVKEKYPHIKIYKALPANDQLLTNIEAFKNEVDLFLIDTPSKDYGGTGVSYDWSILNALNNIPYLIAGGINIDKIKQIESLNFNHNGYDISSGIETNGQKDKEKIKALLTYVKG